MAHACEDLAPALRIQIKWPNDCLIAGRKLAGILCERPAGDQGRMVVGIGLNLDPRWDLRPESLPLVADARYAPVSLAEAGCWPLPDPLDLLAGLRRYLLEAAGLIAAGGWSHLRDGISARDYLAGKLLRLETAQGILVGRGAGIDETGRLLIHTAEGLVPIASARFLNSAEV